MRGLMALLGLVFSVVPLLGYLAFDFTLANRAARAMGEEPVTFVTYLAAWGGLAAPVAGVNAEEAVPSAALPEDLVAMLPLPPPGWTARPAERTDGPVLKGKAGREDAKRIAEVLTDNRGRGVETARLAYVPPDGKGLVVVELARYPDAIFTSFAGMGLKMELEMATMDWSDRDFMTVRGLPLVEARLSPEAPARAFAGDLAGQIQLRAAASRRFTDMDLLALFQTLHVPAMNAAVARPVKGMGEVPVIVVASAMDEAGRALRASEHEAAARAAAEAAAADREAMAAAEAEAQAEAQVAEADKPADGDAEPGDDITIRRGTGEGRARDDALGGACRTENGRKICGVGD